MGASTSAVAERTGPVVVKLDTATARALEKVAKASGKSTTQLTRAALREFLEDYWDMMEVQRRQKRGAKAVAWSEVKRRLGLDG
jgi:predicted transcriptional regulator